MKSTAERSPSRVKTAPSVVKESEPEIGAPERLEWIAKRAYYKAEARAFVPGLEIDDWLEAEADFEEMREH
jgi:hypothetical protein